MNKDEAIQVIRNNFPTGRHQLCEALETLIPEFKESDDEKIRKSLIKSYTNQHSANFPTVDGFTREQILAWLEKQGEQKSADKVEPKFKVGDWIVSNRTNKTYKIDSIDTKDANYIIYSCIPSVYTNEDSPCFSESMIHLWTIQDAKDGDVLATKDIVFIFKHMNKTGLSLCMSYCEVIGNSKLGLGFDFSINDIYPATKEQRDLLFQKMKEAGYEWDADKKELKKIEQNPTWSEKDEKNSLEIKCLIGNYRAGDTEYRLDSWIDSLKERVQPKVKWSEEDKRMINNIIKNLDEGEWLDIYQVDWLKSLKERVQSQSN